MRPMYETHEHLEAEGRTANILGNAWGCEFHKMPIRYNLDFVAKRKEVVLSFCEFKNRNYTMKKIGEMGGYMISLAKWAAAKTFCEASGVPFTLIVTATDGIWYCVIKDFKPDGVIVSGRQDRRDWQDIEPCVLINVDRFTQFNDVPKSKAA